MDERKHILVVDDEADLCLLIKENLEQTGEFVVTTTSNPTEVEEICRVNRPNLILMDVVMPNRKGSDVAKALKENTSTQNIPIVIMSGLGEMVYFKTKSKWLWLPNRQVALDRGEVLHEKIPRLAAEGYGVEGYIEKPFNTNALVEVIKDAMTYLNEDR